MPMVTAHAASRPRSESLHQSLASKFGVGPDLTSFRSKPAALGDPGAIRMRQCEPPARTWFSTPRPNINPRRHRLPDLHAFWLQHSPIDTTGSTAFGRISMPPSPVGPFNARKTVRRADYDDD